MGARWYDGDLGRFIQPDSIIPNPYNPQSLNRYAYVLNNPVKYTDPTGHCAISDVDNTCRTRPDNPNDPITVKDENSLVELSKRAPELLLKLKFNIQYTNSTQTNRIAILDNVGIYLLKNRATDLDFLVSTAGLDALMTNNSTRNFIDDMMLLTEGWHSYDAPYCGFYGPTQCKLENRMIDATLAGLLGNGGTGFLPSYQDPAGHQRSNQVGHFWEYVAAAYEVGLPLASLGNAYHENQGAEGSWEDFWLGQRGVELGSNLSLFFLRPSDVPGWIRQNLAGGN